MPQDVKGWINLSGHPLEGCQSTGIIQKVGWQLELKTGDQSGQNIQELVEAEGRDLGPALRFCGEVFCVGRKDQHLAYGQSQLVRQGGALDWILQNIWREELQFPKELRYSRHVVGEDQLTDGADQTVLDSRRNCA